MRLFVQLVKSMLFRTVAVLLGLAMAFGVAEILLRTMSPQPTGPIQYFHDRQLGAIPVPNQHGRRILPGIYDYRYTNNSYGLRGRREFSFEKTSDLRVLILGDSFAYGIGVDDDETFASVIEESLLDRGLSAEVINGGNAGKGTDYALRFFQVLGHKFQPDLTVLAFFSNDFYDNARSEYYSFGASGDLRVKSLSDTASTQKAFTRRIPLYNWLISWSHAANLIKQAAIAIIIKSEDPPDGTLQGPVVFYTETGTTSPDELNNRLTYIYLENLINEVGDAGSDFMTLYVAKRNEVTNYRETGQFSATELLLQEFSRSLDVLSLSSTLPLALSSEPIDTLFFIEKHWQAEAHDIVGEFISNSIIDRLADRAQRPRSRQ